MLCGMSDDPRVCECNHISSEQNSDLSYTRENTKCCTDEISELTNGNTLSIVKIDLPKDINFFGVIILNWNQNSVLQINQFLNASIDKSHLPILDIPILISSLLI
jgi:hypothetical protein